MRRHRLALIVGIALSVLGLGGCATPETAAPSCTGDQRTATVAQAVPTAAFVPCIATLPAGWDVSGFRVESGGARFTLVSDREPNPVEVTFAETCDVVGATAITPRDDGVRTYVLVRGIAPRYAGRFFDVFPGGCVAYDFNFARGPHIALTDELRSAIDLYPRRELRRELEDELGVTLDP